jgi:hypothetical protein
MLLASAMRVDGFTGGSDTVNRWFDGHQAPRWIVRTPFPPVAQTTRSPADAAEALRELTDLHQRGVVTEAELAALRARLGV